MSTDANAAAAKKARTMATNFLNMCSSSELLGGCCSRHHCRAVFQRKLDEKGCPTEVGTTRSLQRAIHPMDVALDAGGHVGECVMTSHRAKAREVGLREALVLADQRFGKRDVLDEAPTHEFGQGQCGLTLERTRRVDGRDGDVVEGLCAPAAEVEDAARLRVLQEPDIDGYHVIDGDEVARLFALCVAAVFAEKLHLRGVAKLIEVVVGD